MTTQHTEPQLSSLNCTCSISDCQDVIQSSRSAYLGSSWYYFVLWRDPLCAKTSLASLHWVGGILRVEVAMYGLCVAGTFLSFFCLSTQTRVACVCTSESEPSLPWTDSVVIWRPRRERHVNGSRRPSVYTRPGGPNLWRLSFHASAAVGANPRCCWISE